MVADSEFPLGIPMTKDLKEVKEKLKQKQQSWAEEERARAKGKVGLVGLAVLASARAHLPVFTAGT